MGRVFYRHLQALMWTSLPFSMYGNTVHGQEELRSRAQ
jgi:hypothetical protein